MASKKTNIRYSPELQNKIDEYKAATRERYITETIRQLIMLGVKFEMPQSQDHYHTKFENMTRSVRRSIAVEQKLFDVVDNYRVEKDISYENAFLEFTCRGLQAHFKCEISVSILKEN